LRRPDLNQVISATAADYLSRWRWRPRSRSSAEIRHLQREVGEVEAVHGRPKGSSAFTKTDHLRADLQPRAAMRHARDLKQPALHERDISNSSVRIVLPDASILMEYLLDRMTYLVADFVVHPDVMRRNLGLTGGRMHSETVMLALTRTGLRREQAYEIVQRNAMEGMRTGRPLRELLGADPDVARRLTAAQLAAAFDTKHALRWTDAIFARVLGTRARVAGKR
jgi:adenylosuccinate lyase